MKTAAKLSTEYTTSQRNCSKLSVWVNCEDVDPTKSKGRVYTVIRKKSLSFLSGPSENSDEDFSVMLDKEDLHTVLLPQMERKRSQSYTLGLKVLPSMQLSANTEQLLFNIT